MTRHGQSRRPPASVRHLPIMISIVASDRQPDLVALCDTECKKHHDPRSQAPASRRAVSRRRRLYALLYRGGSSALIQQRSMLRVVEGAMVGRVRVGGLGSPRPRLPRDGMHCHRPRDARRARARGKRMSVASAGSSPGSCRAANHPMQLPSRPAVTM